MDPSYHHFTTKQNNHSIIHTREKLGTTCKRVIKYFYERQLEIIKIQQISKDLQQYWSDYKKMFDIVFFLCGIGIITRISKNKFIFTGFKGMAANLNDKILQKINSDEKEKSYMSIQKHDFYLFSEDLNIDGKKWSIRQSVYLQIISQNIFSYLILSQERSVQKMELDLVFKKYSGYCKELLQKQVQNDLICMLQSTNIIDKNELNDIIQWIGPDCINTLGLTYENMHFMLNIENMLNTKINDIDIKQKQYFKNILRDIENTKKEGKESKNNNTKVVNTFQNIDYVKKEDDKQFKEPFKSHISGFAEMGFALLKGKNWKYFVKKFQIIIGRSSYNREQVYNQLQVLGEKRQRWLVDLDFASSKKISRQHAVIIYNFTDQYFEIKCLSRKYPILVNKVTYTYSDRAAKLFNKTYICVGSESFYFFVPNLSYQQELEEDQQIKEQQMEQQMEEEEEREKSNQEQEIKEQQVEIEYQNIE